MGSYLHRVSKRFHPSSSPSSLPFPLSEYIENPDMSFVSGIPKRYWKITGDIISEMIQTEKEAVEVGLLETERDNNASEFDAPEGNLRQIIKLLVSELNILRVQAGLNERTLTQVKNAIRNGYGS